MYEGVMRVFGYARAPHAEFVKHKKEHKMLQDFEHSNRSDGDGNPTGGYAEAMGVHITWQDRPLNRGEKRMEPNGAFVETVIAIALQRIKYYQDSKFSCRENSLAITKLEEALHWLDHRTRDREARGVEGTHTT